MTTSKHKDNDEKLLWSINETAKHLAVHIKTVSRLIEKGELPSLRIGRCIRVPKQAVLDWVESQTRYNSMCVGSAVQGASTCHISASKREVKASSGGHRSPMQTASELESLLEQHKKGKL